MRFILVFLVLLFIPVIFADEALAQRVVFVVRHAEKETDQKLLEGLSSADQTPLSQVGESRAQALADLFRDMGVDSIYTSPVLRTRQTAQPLADSLKIQSKPLEKGAISKFGELHKDEVVLIVGHSNTVPAIIDEIIRRPSGITIRDDEFDALFVLIQKADGSYGLARARY